MSARDLEPGRRASSKPPPRSDPSPPGPRDPTCFQWDPCFKIEGRAECSAGQRVLGGTRVHVTYKVGTVTPLSQSIVPRLNGKVLSGADWLTIRDDGVVAFDARLTLGKDADDVVIDVGLPAEKRFEEGEASPEDDFLLNAVVSGVADSKLADGGWRPSFTGRLHVALPVVFEASGQPVPWAGPRFRQLAASLAKNYGVLVRRQCLAIGTMDFTNGETVAVHLKVYALKANALAFPRRP